MKTVLITGCSSGFGLETSSYFLDRNWKVVATMRAVWRAVNDPASPMRIPAGADAVIWAEAASA